MKIPWRWSNRGFVWAAIGALFAVAVVGIGATVLLQGIFQHQWDSSFVRRLAAWFPIPAARVGNRVIPYATYLVHADAEARYLSGPTARSQGVSATMTAENKSLALDRAIRTVAVEEFANERGIVVTPLDVDRVYDGLIALAGTSTTPGEIDAMLRDEFGWSAAEFKTYVVRPAFTEKLLQQKESSSSTDATAFTKELEGRLQKPDVIRYLKF